jgi:hypothetical protein
MALNYTQEEITAWFNNQPKCRFSGKVIEATLVKEGC